MADQLQNRNAHTSSGAPLTNGTRPFVETPCVVEADGQTLNATFSIQSMTDILRYSMTKQVFSLSTSQALLILKALPPGTKCFEYSSPQSAPIRYVGERDKVIEVFSHDAQEPIAPAWNNPGQYNTRTLWGMTFTFINTVSETFPAEEGEYCVLLEYNFEDINEELPQL